jgi:hypothetical protein
MKKILGVLMFAFVLLLYGCIQPVQDVISLEVQGLDTTAFVQGDVDVDLTGVTVIVTFADNSTQQLSIEEVTVQGDGLTSPGSNILDMGTAGNYYLRISYGGVTVTINYLVRVPQLVANTDWYTGESPYTITTAAGLAGLAEIVNNGTDSFFGKTVLLGNDIDLLGAEWVPIGTSEASPGGAGVDIHTFQGTFDGQDFTISNLYMNRMFTSYQALFGVITNAIIRDFTINNLDVLGYEHVAGVVAKASGNSVLIDNVHLVDAVITGGHWVAGIMGYAGSSSGTIQNCSVANALITAYVLDMQANGDKVGAIGGYLTAYYINNNTVENLVLDFFRDGGGIVGMSNNQNRITNNTVTNATLKLDKTQTENPNFKDGEKDANRYIGAIIGRWGDSTPTLETPNGTETLGAGNSYTNVKTYIRLENESEFLEYLTKIVGRKNQTWYTLV